jgi:hypothetical protein
MPFLLGAAGYIRVGTPRRARPRLPAHIEVVRLQLPEEELTVYERIPSTTVARALLDSRGIVMADRLAAAAREAIRIGLIRRSHAGRLLAEVDAS